MGAVNQLDNSFATITDDNAFLQGRAKSQEEAMRIGDEVKSTLPENFKFRKQISFPLPKPDPVADVKLKPTFVPTPVETAMCKVDFGALFAGEKILFDSGKAAIKPESHALLNRIADGMKECKNSSIEISGHTDALGSEDYNQKLSEARAKAVVAYLTTADGVSGNKLIAKGYGELLPIAPNTREERAKNRRIEFKILEK